MGIPAETSFGTVTIRPISSDLKLDAPAVVKLVSANATMPQHVSQHVSQQNDFQKSWPLQNLFGAQTFRYALFVAILILFGILVGPVNLFVFAKSG